MRIPTIIALFVLWFALWILHGEAVIQWICRIVIDSP